jgi:hypothetical protein
MAVIRLMKKILRPLVTALEPSVLYFIKSPGEYKSDLFIATDAGDKLIDIVSERLRSDTVKKYAPVFNPLVLALAYKDTLTPITIGTDVAYIRSPRKFILKHVRMSLFSASTTLAVEVNLKINGVSITIGNNLMIDVNETSSLTSMVNYNLSLPTDGIIVNDDDVISFDVIEAGSGAIGLIVQLHEGPDPLFTYDEV